MNKDELNSAKQEMLQTYEKSCRDYKTLRIKLIKIRTRMHQEVKCGNIEQAEGYDSVASQYSLVCRGYLDELKIMRETLQKLMKVA
jgi:hypothetical protein